MPELAAGVGEGEEEAVSAAAAGVAMTVDGIVEDMVEDVVDDIVVDVVDIDEDDDSAFGLETRNVALSTVHPSQMFGASPF